MKKAFTLIELILVIIILGILFLSLGFLSWQYMHNLNVQNDKNTISNAFSYAQSTSLSQPNFGNYELLNYIGLKLIPGKSYITYVGATGDKFENSFATKIDLLKHTKIGTGFKIFSGDQLIQNFDGKIYFAYKTYNIGSLVKTGNSSNIITGNKKIKFNLIDSKIEVVEQCLSFDVASGRLYVEKCK